MPKKPLESMLALRLSTRDRKALETAAEDEGIPASTLVRMITLEWLRRRDYLPPKSRHERR